MRTAETRNKSDIGAAMVIKVSIRGRISDPGNAVASVEEAASTTRTRGLDTRLGMLAAGR
jgi:hypothetical protein